MLNTSGLGKGWTQKCAVCESEFHSVSNKQTVCSTACRFALYQNRGADDACWEWIGPINNQGYGVLFLNQNKESGRRMVSAAHRYAYEKFVAKPTEGMCIMHKCDNRKCTNPAHLVEGTWADNNGDRSKKGRSGKRVYSEEDRAKYSLMLRGEGSSTAKLSEVQVREIRSDRSLGCQRAAKKYGVAATTIKRIRNGKSWSHVV